MFSLIWDQVQIFRDSDAVKREVVCHALQFIQSCLRHGFTLQQLRDEDVAKFKIKEYVFNNTLNRYTHVCDYHVSGLVQSLQQWNTTHAPSLTQTQFITQMLQQPQLAIGCLKPQ
jgi:hypothetical protein